MVSIVGNSAIGIVLAILVLAVLIFNVVYIGGIRREFSKPGVHIGLSKTAADIIFGIDIFLILLTGLFLIYCIWTLATAHRHTPEITKTTAAVVPKVTPLAVQPLNPAVNQPLIQI